ncbi:MAG: hypothetical protein V4505_02890 [Pseudomonadota bacterium]
MGSIPGTTRDDDTASAGEPSIEEMKQQTLEMLRQHRATQRAAGGTDEGNDSNGAGMAPAPAAEAPWSPPPGMPWPPVGSVSEAALLPPNPPSGFNRDGTYSLRGDRKTIRDQLDKAGITMFLPIQGGLMIGTSQAQRAHEMVLAEKARTESENGNGDSSAPQAMRNVPQTGETDGAAPYAYAPYTSQRKTDPESPLAKEIVGHDGPMEERKDLRNYERYLDIQNRVNNGLDGSLKNLQARRQELVDWDKSKDDTPKIQFYHAFGTTDAEVRAKVLQRIDDVIEKNKAMSVKNFRLGDSRIFGDPKDYEETGAYVLNPDSAPNIYLGPAFDIVDSMPQLFTHEMSHMEGSGPAIPYSAPPLTGTIDGRIDKKTGKPTGREYGSGNLLAPEDAPYHADTFGFYITGTTHTKREPSYYDYLDSLPHKK